MPKSTSSLSRKIAKAAEINNQMKLLTVQLDSLKEDIRTEAVRAGLGRVASPIEFDCKLGICSVAHVDDNLAIAKGVDVRDLRTILRPMMWAELFVEQVIIQLRPTAMAVYKNTLNSTEKKATTKFIEYKEGTPRVTLPKLP